LSLDLVNLIDLVIAPGLFDLVCRLDIFIKGDELENGCSDTCHWIADDEQHFFRGTTLVLRTKEK
jgi:hypothetical protein